MRIAYVTTYDPEDVLKWSGLGRFIYDCLRKHGFDVDPIGPLPPYRQSRRFWLKLKNVWYNRVWQKRLGYFSMERDHSIAKFFAEAVEKKIASRNYDVIIAPGTIPIAFLKSDIPIVTWTDATFHCLVTAYPEYGDLTKDFYRDGELLEQCALKNARLCAFSSDWAARSAIHDYGVEPTKVKVIPFGANTDDNVTEAEVVAAISSRSKNMIRLLFVGVDFARKGGPKVFEVLDSLLSRDIPAQLEIIGCMPEVPIALREHTIVRGFVSKQDAAGCLMIANAFLSSHWLILLPSAECYGLVFAEANRYGVPCVATDTGGIPTIVKNDRNGKLFALNASSVEIATYIADKFSNEDQYLDMAKAAYREYTCRLNWRVAAETLAACVSEILH